MSEYDRWLDRQLEDWYADPDEQPGPDPDDFDVRDLDADLD